MIGATMPNASEIAWHSSAESCAANQSASLMSRLSPSAPHTSLHASPHASLSTHHSWPFTSWQVGGVVLQPVVQPSLFASLPSSHSSTPSTTPLPQNSPAHGHTERRAPSMLQLVPSASMSVRCADGHVGSDEQNRPPVSP